MISEINVYFRISEIVDIQNNFLEDTYLFCDIQNSFFQISGIIISDIWTKWINVNSVCHTHQMIQLTIYGQIKTAKQQTIIYSNTVIGRLGHWPLMGGLLHSVQRGGAWAVWGPAQSHPCCTKCNSPPINCQRINFILFDVAL